MSDEEYEPGSRFDPKSGKRTLHQGRYWNELLPEEMVEALDAAWLRVKGVTPKYCH